MDYQELCRPLVENDFLVGDRKVLHQRVVKRTGGKSIYFENEVPEIQSVLRTDTGSISIQEGAWEMVNLSIALHRLDMFEEAATIGLWTVKLFRTLVSVDSKIYMPYLFHALRHLAAFYTDIDKLDAAVDTIEESVKLSRSIQTPTVPKEVKIQLAGSLMTSSTVFTARNEHDKACQYAHEAVEVLEAISGTVNQEDPMETGKMLMKFNWYELMDTIKRDPVIYIYARALHLFSWALENVRLMEGAAKIGIKALATFRLISPWYPNGPIQTEIANILARLAEQEFCPFIPLEEAYSCSKESERIYRKFCEQNSKKYGKVLCNVLWEQANILGSLKNRGEDALKVWKEMTTMAKEIIEEYIYIARALDKLSWSFRRLNL